MRGFECLQAKLESRGLGFKGADRRHVGVAFGGERRALGLEVLCRPQEGDSLDVRVLCARCLHLERTTQRPQLFERLPMSVLEFHDPRPEAVVLDSCGCRSRGGWTRRPGGQLRYGLGGLRGTPLRRRLRQALLEDADDPRLLRDLGRVGLCPRVE